jgi:hypothetical protein
MERSKKHRKHLYLVQFIFFQQLYIVFDTRGIDIISETPCATKNKIKTIFTMKHEWIKNPFYYLAYVM